MWGPRPKQNGPHLFPAPIPGRGAMRCRAAPPASRPTRAENGRRRLALESRSGWSEPPEVWAGTPEAWQGATLISSTLLD